MDGKIKTLVMRLFFVPSVPFSTHRNVLAAERLPSVLEIVLKKTIRHTHRGAKKNNSTVPLSLKKSNKRNDFLYNFFLVSLLLSQSQGVPLGALASSKRKELMGLGWRENNAVPKHGTKYQHREWAQKKRKSSHSLRQYMVSPFLPPKSSHFQQLIFVPFQLFLFSPSAGSDFSPLQRFFALTFCLHSFLSFFTKTMFYGFLFSARE